MPSVCSDEITWSCNLVAYYPHRNVCFYEVVGSHSLMTCHPYLTFCILMKRMNQILQCHVIWTLFFVFWLNSLVIPFGGMPSVHYFLCFNEMKGVMFFDAMPSVPYFFVFYSNYRLLFHAICALLFVFLWSYRVVSFDDTPSVPYFLCFEEMVGSKLLLPCPPYLNFCVLTSS